MELSAIMAIFQLVERGAGIVSAFRGGDRSPDTIQSALSLIGELRGTVGNLTDPAPTAEQMAEARENIARGFAGFGTVADNTRKG